MGLDQYIECYPPEYPDFTKELLYYRKNWKLQTYMNEKYGYNNDWYATPMRLTVDMIKDIMEQTPTLLDNQTSRWYGILEYAKRGLIVTYSADW